MQRDLSQAAEIQRRHAARPRRRESRAPTWPGFNAACRTVGGDYYDFFPYPDGRVALALGDVSGKGMPASLMMMALQARVQVLAEDPGDLAAFMTQSEQGAPAPSAPSNRFITFFFCVLDPPRAICVLPTRDTIRRSWCAPRARRRCWRAAARCWVFCPSRPTAR